MNQSANILTVIADHFGEELSPDLIDSISRIDDLSLAQFAQKIRSLERTPYLPDKGDGEVRPFLTYYILEEFARLSGVGIATDTAFSPDTFSHGPMVDLVKRQLLYCHKITLHDPLPYIADFLPGFGSKEKLQNYLSWLYEMAPLVKEGIVTFLSETGFKDSPGIELNELSRMFPDANESIDKAIAEEVGVSSTDLLVRYFRQQSEKHLWEMAHAIARLPGKVDYHFVHRYDHQLLRQQIGNVLRANGINEIRHVSMPELISIQVPNLDMLSIDDIVTIRRDDDTFEEWRNRLKRALLFAKDHSCDLFDREGDVSMSIRSDFRDHVRELENLLSSTSWLSKFKKSAHGFTIGAIGGLAAQVLSGNIALGAALIPGFVTALLGLVFPAESCSDRQTAVAALHHYTLFSPQRE